MGNTDKNGSKKSRSKIRIRLVDPNIPDSYVCEIFESSLENEDETKRSNKLSPVKANDSLKPKNYFEILMSKNGKKSNVNNSTNIQASCEEKLINRRRQKNQKKRNLTNHFIGGRENDRKCNTDSSDDENLLEIQRKCKLESNEEGQEEEEEEEVEVTADKTDTDIFTVFDSSKADLSQKKKLSILNYFSKPKNNTKENSEKLEEIMPVVHSFKTNQTTNCLKPAEKQKSSKTHQTEKKSSLNEINKENVKLAPLFCKKVNKVMDSEKQRARLDFLYKGYPSTNKKNENKNVENVSSFPTFNHVQQRNESAYWRRREIRLPLPEVPISSESASNTTKIFSLPIENSIDSKNTVFCHSVKINEGVLNKIKCKYVELNIDSIIDGLKEKREKFNARVQEIEKSKNDATGFEELNILWSEKYKPNSSEILGNENVVKKLKKWLESWKSFDEELKNLAKSSRALKKTKDEDSGDDSSDDFLFLGSESYGLRPPGNVCFLSGPNGCGKTALVYALANELEFGVLELNSSSKRTGKKVLSDLQEATQSHKVHRVNLPSPDLFKKDPKKKKSKRRKKNKKEPEKGKTVGQGNDCKISLILIEDADIVFEEHDEGFFSAIASLVQTSKRPLIFLTNEPNCHNYYSLKPEQCLILEMKLPSFHNSCAVLDVVSSLEGAAFDKELIETLVSLNQFDFRKSLLQLEFWINSGHNPVAFQKQFDLGHLWWGLSKFLFNQDIKHFLKPKGRKRKRVNDFFDSSDEEIETVTKKFKSDSGNSKKGFKATAEDAVPRKRDPLVESCFRVLDLASVLDGFRLPGSQEPIPGLECRPKDSLSLSENMEESVLFGRRLTEQLSEELMTLSTRIFARNRKNEVGERKLSFVPPSWEEILWRNSQMKASEELSVLISQHRGLGKRSLHVDYLPILRNICRAERNRSEMNPKRKNRFFHYLNNLGLELTDENLEINCDVFER